MKKIMTLAMTCLVAIGVTTGANAEDNPDSLLRTPTTPVETVAKASPGELWQAYLAAQKLDNGVNQDGVTLIPERDIIISSATQHTKVRLGQPGWIESRVVSFERAELEAKAKIIKYFAESADTVRTIKMFENAAWTDGDVQEVKQLGDVHGTLKRIGKKNLVLAEKTLDSALQKLDPDYNPEEYADKTPEELQVIVEDLFTRRIKSLAYRSLIGVTPVFSAENKNGNEYQVLVGVIWSPKLNRLALSLANDAYNIPAVAPNMKLADQLPTESASLLGTWGTRIVIDENGHYAILAYAQAQPRQAGPDREQSALQDAREISANRARSLIVNFVREGLNLRTEEQARELSREFEGGTVGTENVRKFSKSVTGRKVTVQLSGLHSIKQWDMKHPASGQKVAGAVVAWSPSSVSLSKKMDATMKSRPANSPEMGSTQASQDNTGSAIKSMEVNTSAY